MKPDHDPICAERDCRPSVATVTVISLAFWIALGIAAPDGLRATMATLISGVVLFGFGQAFLYFTGGQAIRGGVSTLLALPAGVVVFSGLAQVTHHRGLPFWPLLGVALALTPFGLWCAGQALRRCWKERVTYGWMYLIVILLVGLTYYLPKSQHDSVRTADQGVEWFYPDSAFHEAIVAVLSNNIAPLRNPGFYSQELSYHYGRHALASSLVEIFGISAGDSLARSIPMLGLASLALAAISLGRATARNAKEKPLAGLLAVILVFFLPSILAIGMNEGHSCSRLPQHIVPPNIVSSELSLPLGDSSFIHYLGGGSILWAGIVVLTVASLLSQENDSVGRGARRALPWTALMLAILGMTLNGIAGLCSAAVVVGFALLQKPGWQSLAFAVAGMTLFRLFQILSGLHHTSAGAMWVGPGGMVFGFARITLAGFLLLFGFRSLCILVFAIGTRQTKLAMTLFVLAHCGLYLLFVLQGYPLSILAVLLGGYAAAPMAAIAPILFAQGPASGGVGPAAIACYRNYLRAILILASVMVPLSWFPFLRHRSSESIYGFFDPASRGCSGDCGARPAVEEGVGKELDARAANYGDRIRPPANGLPGRGGAISSQLWMGLVGKLGQVGRRTCREPGFRARLRRTRTFRGHNAPQRGGRSLAGAIVRLRRPEPSLHAAGRMAIWRCPALAAVRAGPTRQPYALRHSGRDGSPLDRAEVRRHPHLPGAGNLARLRCRPNAVAATLAQPGHLGDPRRRPDRTRGATAMMRLHRSTRHIRVATRESIHYNGNKEKQA